MFGDVLPGLVDVALVGGVVRVDSLALVVQSVDPALFLEVRQPMAGAAAQFLFLFLLLGRLGLRLLLLHLALLELQFPFLVGLGRRFLFGARGGGGARLGLLDV